MQVSLEPEHSRALSRCSAGETNQSQSDGKYTSISFDDNQIKSGARTRSKSNSKQTNQRQSSQNDGRIKAEKARRSAVYSLFKRLIKSRLFLIHIICLTVPIQIGASINQIRSGQNEHQSPYLIRNPIMTTLSSRQDIGDDWAKRIPPAVNLPEVASSTMPSLTKRVDRRILSEFVVNQGQKLLKNIADTVEDGLVARGQIYSSVVSTAKPTSRLYDLLFPSISHFGSNDNLMLANRSLSALPGTQPMADSSAAGSKSLSSPGELVVPLNLSAPYESRARTWLTSKLTGRKQRSGSNQILDIMDGSDIDGKLHQYEHGEISSEGAINWPTSVTDEPSSDLSGSDVLGEDGNQPLEVTETEPESASQSIPIQAELDNQEPAGGIQDSNEGSTMDESTVEYQPDFNQSTSEFYTRDQFVPSKPVVENLSEYREEEQRPAASMAEGLEETSHPVEDVSNDQTLEEQSDEGTIRSKESAPSNTADQYNIDNQFLPAEHNSMRIEMATPDSNPDRSNSLTLSSNDTFLTSNLPTQYDTGLMRLPPEGYYDDYFKPDISSSTILSQSQHGNVGDNPLLQDATSNASLVNFGHLSSGFDNNSQFYTNPQLSRQPQTTSSRPVEFIASNKTPSTQGISMMSATYEESNHSEPRDSQPRPTTSSLELASSANRKSRAPNQPSANVSTYQRIEQTSDQNSSAELQPIRLIIADTFSNSRDPKSNEKVISYTNEAGRNVTRQIGRPESNFVNREMNEIAPVVDGKEKYRDTEPQSVVKREPENDDDDELTSTPSNFIAQPVVRPEVVDRGIKSSQNVINRTSQFFDPNQVDRVQEMIHDISRMTSSARLDGADSRWTVAKGANMRQKSGKSVVVKDNRPSREVRTKMNKQPTLHRPQVTQVNLNPKDLIMNPPTPQPVLSTASTISSIVELPTKVKRLRDNQPDKNELMNELLTALDRVKVAIYKLQPLTAKMNAIYRKSVTSNTRNLVMDNHKGTYAKRYPPGDYDDTYDRIHPADQASKHWTESRSRQRRAADLLLTDQGSKNLPTYLSVSGSNISISNNDAPIGVKDGLNSSESQIIATGIGWRFPGGNTTSQLRVATEAITDDAGSERLPSASSKKMLLSRLGDDWPPPPMGTQKSDSFEDDATDAPLFGYRITIYQAPNSEDQNGPEDDPTLVYRVSDKDRTDEDDTMATSESSISETPVAGSVERIGNRAPLAEGLSVSESTEDDTESFDEPLTSESKGKKSEKKKHEESKSKKKAAKEKEKEDKSKSKKSQSKKKKDEEEVKKKKEYKKIKHNKGVVSKEKKTMHRDKHIKAHDRGAAKEKALKERTQIEFFEREQIVDDEYDKGKKSLAKANWQTGHESKKMNKDSGDTMPSGGSHYVKHEAKDGQATGAESSMSKSSNKFEKKQLEAKGKVFKGWREKGYKIITETEFIDRGSLHDSAYKKRDKGAAHHQKYKKHEDNSEGHHGSEVEHKKKSHKKEEKKSKMNERKGKESKKDEKEAEENKKKKKVKKKKFGDNEHEESIVAPTVEPFRLQPLDKQRQHNSNRSSPPSSEPSNVLSSTQFRSKLRSQTRHRQNLSDEGVRQRNAASLMRLLNNEHDERLQPRYPTRMQAADTDARSNFSSPGSTNTSSAMYEGIGDKLIGFTLTSNFLGSDSNRRSDQASPSLNSSLPKIYNSIRSLSSILPTIERNTVLDIVDNSTGRQMNKTRIGTYDFTDDNGPTTVATNSQANLTTSALSKNLAKILSFAAHKPVQQQPSPDENHDRNFPATHNSVTSTPVLVGQNSTANKPVQAQRARQKRPPLEPTGDLFMLDPQHPASRSQAKPDESNNARRLNNLINVLPKLTAHQQPAKPAAMLARQVSLSEPAKFAPLTQGLSLIQHSQASSPSGPAQGYLANQQLVSMHKQDSDFASYLQPALGPLLAGVAPSFANGNRDQQLGFMGLPSSSLNMAFPFLDYEQQDLASGSRNFFLDRPNTI